MKGGQEGEGGKKASGREPLIRPETQTDRQTDTADPSSLREKPRSGRNQARDTEFVP